MLELKGKREDNLTVVKQVYNARHRYNRSIRGTRTEMQNLLKNLEDNNYVYNYRTVIGSKTVQDIFFAHPECVKFFNTFSTVLVMDSTYKTSQYKMPFLRLLV